MRLGQLHAGLLLNACRYLLNVLHADPRLHRSELAALLEEVFAFLEVEPSEREQRCGGSCPVAGLFGVVGKAPGLRNNDDAELLRELTRSATEPEQVIGAHISSTLPERSQLTDMMSNSWLNRAESQLKRKTSCEQEGKDHVDRSQCKESR